MFSSNQILSISGNIDKECYLKSALDFAVRYEYLDEIEEGNYDFRVSNSLSTIYQITEKGKYCIGFSNATADAPEGWQKYSFKYDSDIISRIIIQYLKEFQIEYGEGDGYRKGFLMRTIESTKDYDDLHDINNYKFCLVYFTPYTIEYYI